MENGIKISSIVIAKNEEQNIERCIKSQLNCIDEIVVIVDSETTDRTFEIAKSFEKVKCEVRKWEGYAKAKQYALSLTNYNWIFWIDADETISKELEKELNIFKTRTPSFSVYSVPRKAYFLNKWIKHSGWYPGRVNRLFDKNKVDFKDKEVHESLQFEGKVGRLENDLEHFTDPSIEHYFKKFNEYTTLAAKQLFKENKKIRMIDVLLRPPFLFLKMYIIKLGFLDGFRGFILAVFSSAYVFTKYCKLWELKTNMEKTNGTK